MHAHKFAMRDHGTDRAAAPGWRPWLAGAAAGSAMTTIGHPFDTTKVRMQASATAYKTTMHCIRETVAHEGLLALYKGLAPALMTTCLTSGLRFGVQFEFNARLAHFMNYAGFESLPATARILAEGGGGAACGIVLPIIFTPMELIKVKRQVLKDNSATNLQIARQVAREHGFTGLYTGHTLTVCRSTIGNTALFGSYEGWRSMLHAALGVEPQSSSTLANTLAGVLSGWTTTLCCFPIDALKSRRQVALGTERQQTGANAGILRGLVELWREGACYRGVGAMLLRAIPVHAVYMPTYSLVLRALSGEGGAAGGGDGQPQLRRRRSSTHYEPY